MPLTTDNPTDPARDGSDEEWARWEQTFRNARPVLPEAAMARIEATLRRESGGGFRTSRLRRRVFLLMAALIAINVLGFLLISHYFRGGAGNGQPDNSAASIPITDRYPLTVPIGPLLAAPDRPILPLAENWKWISSDVPLETAAPSTRPVSQPVSPRLRGAQRLFAASPNGWHALGLLEMSRAEHVPAAFVAPVPPHVEEYWRDALWRTLEEPTLDVFYDHVDQLISYDPNPNQQFWLDTFLLLRAANQHDIPLAARVHMATVQVPRTFPSKAGDRARFDLLVELGVPKAQAALEVLTTRSYEPLKKLRGLDGWEGAAQFRERLRDGYLIASRDFVERIFALRLLGNSKDVGDLIERAGNLPYLLNPPDLEVLLVRLGPIDAWEKLLRPLMDDEVAFIENPPRFAEFSPRPENEVIVESAGKSDQGGAVAYRGPIVLTAGPWQMTCDTLTAVRTASRAMMLNGSGNVHVHGVIGLLSATANTMTLSTESGELKLTGSVHLEEWQGSRDVKACTIVATGEIRSEE